MPEIPKAALTAAAAIERELMSDTFYATAIDSDDQLARVALEAAAPILAEAVAKRILDHMEAHGPGPTALVSSRLMWRRRFRIAAQVAGFAFSSPEDIKRAAIAAIARGEAAVCHDDHGQAAVPACRGFQWIGQSFATCDGCGKPAWEHDGMQRLRDGAKLTSLSDDSNWEVVPWKPGEAEAIKRKWS